MDYDIPQDVFDEWVKQCDCCPDCSDCPCPGAMTGGLCDNMPCRCDDEFDFESGMHEY